MVLVVFSALMPAAQAQECGPSGEAPSVFADNDPVPVIIEAPTIESLGPLVRATGGVFFLSDNKRIRASEVSYDLDSGEGVMKDVTFTTCKYLKPHYRIEAREIKIGANNKIYAKHPALYLGSVKIMSLPALRFRVGGQGVGGTVFPRPSYSSEEGFTLSQTFRLVDRDRTEVTADVAFGTEHGIQGELRYSHGLNGNLAEFPGRRANNASVRSYVTGFAEAPAGQFPTHDEADPAGAARLRGYGTWSLRQRTYDIRNEERIVYRQPELGVIYEGSQINLTGTRLHSALQIHPTISVGWGRFRESPGPESYTARRSVDVAAAFNVLPTGPHTAVQPLARYSWAKYETGDTYRNRSVGVDVSHMFSNGSLVFGRYVRRWDSGQTPFLFDNLDIPQDIQAGFRAYNGSHVIGFSIGYDAGVGTFYDWGLTYGHRTDCIVSSVRWMNRTKRLSFDIVLVGM